MLEPILETSSDQRLTNQLHCTISCAEVGVDVGGGRGCGSGGHEGGIGCDSGRWGGQVGH